MFGSAFFVLCCLAVFVLSQNNEVSFKMTPSIIENSTPWIQLFCKVPAIGKEEKFVDIRITKTVDNNTTDVVKIQRNGIMRRYNLSSDVQTNGELSNKLGGYLFVRINEPKRSTEGQYNCSSQYMTENSTIKSHISKEVNIIFDLCCIDTKEIYNGLNSQYEVFETMYGYIREKNEIEKEMKNAELQDMKEKIENLKMAENKSAIDLKEANETSKRLMKLEKMFVVYVKKMKEKTGRLNNLTGASLYENLESVMKPYSFGYRTRAVILRRVSASVDFGRTYKEYEEGFGELDGNLWLGLKKMHELTKYQTSLHITLVKANGVRTLIDYVSFKVSDAKSGYRLSLAGYVKSNKAFNDEINFFLHNGNKFSAKDRDQDTDGKRHCAKLYNCGFWFYNCYRVNPTGIYGVNGTGKAMAWYGLTGWNKGLTFIEFSITLS